MTNEQTQLRSAVAALEGQRVRPTPGSIWKHHSGRLYAVDTIANLPGRDDYPETVIYQDDTLQSWAAPLSDWHRRMTLVKEFPQPVSGVGGSWGPADSAAASENARLTRELARMKGVLHEAADELDAYYRAEYPLDHPIHERNLKYLLDNNPARAALIDSQPEGDRE